VYNITCTVEKKKKCTVYVDDMMSITFLYAVATSGSLRCSLRDAGFAWAAVIALTILGFCMYCSTSASLMSFSRSLGGRFGRPSSGRPSAVAVQWTVKFDRLHVREKLGMPALGVCPDAAEDADEDADEDEDEDDEVVFSFFLSAAAAASFAFFSSLALSFSCLALSFFS